MNKNSRKCKNYLSKLKKKTQEKGEEKQREYQQKRLKYQKEMKEKQLKFQKQVLELTSRGNSIENEFSFSQNTIWTATENFSSRGRLNFCVIF